MARGRAVGADPDGRLQSRRNDAWRRSDEFYGRSVDAGETRKCLVSSDV